MTLSDKASQLGRVLVISVRKDATKRRIWEDGFASQLAKHDVAATASYTLFPDAPPDTGQVIASVKEKYFDGILVIHKRVTEINKTYINGSLSTEQTQHYYPLDRPYWQQYGVYYREITHPGYIDSQAVDVRAIDVSSTGNGGRMIWSATSRTPDPGSVNDVQRDIVDLVVTELQRLRIINFERK